jgi:hypothetical protein
VNVLLGNQCFTTAIAALNRVCTQLSNEQRCWLAIQFTMCFQRASGLKVRTHQPGQRICCCARCLC